MLAAAWTALVLAGTSPPYWRNSCDAHSRMAGAPEPLTCGLAHGYHPSSIHPKLAQQVAKGVHSEGNLLRLREALRRTELGEPTVLLALGSSVTASFGGAVGRMQDRYKLAYSATGSGMPRWCTGICVNAGWLLPIRSFLARPGTNVTLVNAGRNSESVAGLMKGCTASFVPSEADIVLLDAASIPPEAATFERLLRYLLALPHRPAVILLHLFQWCSLTNRSATEADAVRADRTLCNSRRSLETSYTEGAAIEAPLNELAAHYGLPVLSVREAFYSAALRGDPEYAPSYLTQDGLHPRYLTDSSAPVEPAYRYQLLIALLVNHFLSRVVAQTKNVAHGLVRDAALPSAMHFEQSGTREGSWERCYYADGEQTNMLPLPLIGEHEGWRFSEFDTVTSFDGRRSFRKGAGNVVEGALAPSAAAEESHRQPKSNPGLTTFTAGSSARFRLELDADAASRSTRGVGGGSPAAPPTLTLTLMYLSSYEGMGAARVTCTQGCSCATTEVDGHRGAERQPQYVSIWEDREVPLAMHGRTCVVTVQALRTTRSDGFKFKIKGLVFRAQGVS